MRETLKSVFALLLSFGLLQVANGLLSTVLGIRSDIESFDTAVIGVVMGSFFFGILLGAQYAIGVVARVGHIRAFGIFASVISISALAHVLHINVFTWILLRMMAGFCIAGMVMVTESWINERAENQFRGRILSLYMITNYAAAGTGQLLLPLADPAGYKMFSLASIVFSLALVPVLLTRAPTPDLPGRIQTSLREVFATSPLGMVGSICAGMLGATTYGLSPVFSRQIGLSLGETSLFMGALVLGGLLLQWPLGHLSDRLDRRTVLMGTAFATALAAGAIAFSAEKGLVFLIPSALLFGALSFTLYSLSAAQANDLAAPGTMIQTARALLVAYSLGAIAGPVLGGQVMSFLPPEFLYVYCGVIALVLGGYTGFRKRIRLAGERKRRFIPKPESVYSSEVLYSAVRNQMDRDIARMAGGRR